MQKLIIICGYSNVGKTWVLDDLQRRGHQILSTSKVLDDFTARLVKIVDGSDIQKTIQQLLTKQGTVLNQPPRQLKINLAENLIVPVFGREAIVQAALKKISLASEGLVFFESIGGEELILLVRSIDKTYKSCDYQILNLRHVDEKPGVDIRELAGEGQTVSLKKVVTDIQMQHDGLDSGRILSTIN